MTSELSPGWRHCGWKHEVGYKIIENEKSQPDSGEHYLLYDKEYNYILARFANLIDAMNFVCEIKEKE